MNFVPLMAGNGGVPHRGGAEQTRERFLRGFIEVLLTAEEEHLVLQPGFTDMGRDARA